MARVVVCGGSLIGLATSMLLARDGHEVTVLERDAADPPDGHEEVWATWDRGVPQFRQPHNVFPRFRILCEAEFPEIVHAMVGEGMFRDDFLATMPPFITDREPRPGDDRFWFLTGRRPILEAVFARAAAAEPGVEVLRGVKGAGLLDGGASIVDGLPHVTGVATDDGRELRADLVVDAMGRRTQLADWLEAVGGRRPVEEAEDCGFTYYTRYFSGPELPARLAPVVTPLGTISILTLSGDNDTWSVTLFTASGDQPMKRLRHPEVFERVLRACPLHAHWHDGEPITEVMPISGVMDKYRRFLVDDQPVATGVLTVGDAWACTNPSAGRGLSIGLWHATRLRDVVRDRIDDAEDLARAWDAVSEAEFTPWYRSQVAADRARVAEIMALREGREPPPPDPTFAAIGAAIPYDPDVYRAFSEVVGCITPAQEVFARPGLMEKAQEVAGRVEPLEIPGPSRDELLELVS